MAFRRTPQIAFTEVVSLQEVVSLLAGLFLRRQRVYMHCFPYKVSLSEQQLVDCDKNTGAREPVGIQTNMKSKHKCSSGMLFVFE